MATATYFKNTPNSSAAASFTWAVACPVGSTIYIGIQHQGGGAVTVTDSAGNTWVKEKATLDYSTPAAGQRILDVYSCQPTATVSSVTVAGTSTYWVLSAAVINALVSTQSSVLYAGTQPTTGSLTVTTSSIALAFIAYNASTAGTEGAAMASPWANAGINNFSTTQSDIWRIAAPAANGTQSAVVTSAAGVSNYGVIGLAVAPAAAPNVGPSASIMARPVPQAPGTVTVTGGGTDSDGTVKAISFEYDTTANNPGTPTITLVTNNLNTNSTTATGTFTGAAGRYKVRTKVTDNNDAIAYSAYVLIDVYAASGADVLPYAEISGTYTRYGTASSDIAALTDGDLTTGLISGAAPAGEKERVQWCAFGPGDITAKITHDQTPLSPGIGVQVTWFKEDGVTQIYQETIPAPVTNGQEDTVPSSTAGVAALSAAVPNLTDRCALITETSATQA